MVEVEDQDAGEHAVLMLMGKCDGEDIEGRKDEVASAWEEYIDQILQI